MRIDPLVVFVQIIVTAPPGVAVFVFDIDILRDRLVQVPDPRLAVEQPKDLPVQIEPGLLKIL
jgi:hypothetical protein